MGQHVAPRTQFEGDAVAHQTRDDFLVVNGLHAMTNAVRPQFIQRHQDVSRRARHRRFSCMHGDAQALRLRFLKQRRKGLGGVIHLVVGQIKSHKMRFSFQNPVAPPRIVLHAFDALEQANEADHHGEFALRPGHPALDGFEHAVGIHPRMGVEKKGGSVTQFKHADVADLVHVGTHLVRQLLHFVFRVDDITGVQEFVEDRGQIFHGGLHQKGLVKRCVVAHVHAAIHSPALQG